MAVQCLPSGLHLCSRALVFTRKAWLGHNIPSCSGAFAIAHLDAALRYCTASRKALA